MKNLNRKEFLMLVAAVASAAVMPGCGGAAGAGGLI